MDIVCCGAVCACAQEGGVLRSPHIIQYFTRDVSPRVTSTSTYCIIIINIIFSRISTVSCLSVCLCFIFIFFCLRMENFAWMYRMFEWRRSFFSFYQILKYVTGPKMSVLYTCAHSLLNVLFREAAAVEMNLKKTLCKHFLEDMFVFFLNVLFSEK